MKNLVMDSQVLNAIQKCAYYYELGMIKRLAPDFKAEALESGDLLHTMLKVFYKLKIARPDIPYARLIELSVMLGNEKAVSLDQELTTSEEVIYHFSEYCKFYEGDFWIPKQVEQPFIIKLHEEEEFTLYYEGIVDLIVDSQAGEAGVDHKSSRRNYQNTTLPLSNQFKGYAKCLGLSNFIVNKIGFQKTLKPADRFKREFISYTQAQLDEWTANTIWWAQQLVFFLETGTFPQNHTSCDKYSGCTFAQACLADKGAARDWILGQHFVEREQWNPHTRDEILDQKIQLLIEQA